MSSEPNHQDSSRNGEHSLDPGSDIDNNTNHTTTNSPESKLTPEAATNTKPTSSNWDSVIIEDAPDDNSYSAKSHDADQDLLWQTRESERLREKGKPKPPLSQPAQQANTQQQQQQHNQQHTIRLRQKGHAIGGLFADDEDDDEEEEEEKEDEPSKILEQQQQQQQHQQQQQQQHKQQQQDTNQTISDDLDLELEQENDIDRILDVADEILASSLPPNDNNNSTLSLSTPIASSMSTTFSESLISSHIHSGNPGAPPSASSDLDALLDSVDNDLDSIVGGGGGGGGASTSPIPLESTPITSSASAQSLPPSDKGAEASATTTNATTNGFHSHNPSGIHELEKFFSSYKRQKDKREGIVVHENAQNDNTSLLASLQKYPPPPKNIEPGEFLQNLESARSKRSLSKDNTLLNGSSQKTARPSKSPTQVPVQATTQTPIPISILTPKSIPTLITPTPTPTPTPTAQAQEKQKAKLKTKTPHHPNAKVHSEAKEKRQITSSKATKTISKTSKQKKRNTSQPLSGFMLVTVACGVAAVCAAAGLFAWKHRM